MAFTKITNSELNSRGATTLPNQPTISAAALKQEFDAPAKEIVAPHFNNLIDELEAETAAANIGIETPTGRIGETVQEVLNDVSTDLKNVEDKVEDIDHSELEDAILKRHSHENKNVLDEFSVSAQGNLLWDGIPVGGGGSNYENLENKPQINGHQLIGNMSDNDLDLASASSVASLASAVGSMSSDLGIAQSRIRNLQEVTTQLSNDKADKSDLGTASSKNSTSVVTDSTDLVESGAVKDIVGWGNKNLVYTKLEGHNVNSSGLVQSGSTYSLAVAKVEANKEYTISPRTSFTDTNFVFAFFANEIKDQSVSYNNSRTVVETTESSLTFTAPINGYVGIRIATVNSVIQLEEGSTATAYEPYHVSVEETIPQVVSDAVGWDVGDLIVYPYRDGTKTIYGVTFTDNGDGSITVNGTATADAYFFIADSASKDTIPRDTNLIFKGGKSNVKLRCYVTNASTVVGDSEINVYIPSGVDYNVTLLVSRGSTVNNVIIYPKLYHFDVDKQKADNSVIAPVENGATASQAYAVGQHFIRDGAFCTCTQPIAQGGTFTLNTNYTAGDVASELEVSLVTCVTDKHQNITINSSRNNLFKYGKLRFVDVGFNVTSDIDSTNASQSLFRLRDRAVGVFTFMVYNALAPFGYVTNFALYTNGGKDVYANNIIIPVGNYIMSGFYLERED